MALAYLLYRSSVCASVSKRFCIFCVIVPNASAMPFVASIVACCVSRMASVVALVAS